VKSDVESIFNYWCEMTGHTRARLDPKREATIGAMLRVGYTVGDLCLAIDGNVASAYHHGANDTGGIYDSIGLIFRNADQVDKFMTLGERARRIIDRTTKREADAPAVAERKEVTPEERAKVKQMLERIRNGAKV
jgi:hypothetical protein